MLTLPLHVNTFQPFFFLIKTVHFSLFFLRLVLSFIFNDLVLTFDLPKLAKDSTLLWAKVGLNLAAKGLSSEQKVLNDLCLCLFRIHLFSKENGGVEYASFCSNFYDTAKSVAIC